MNTHRAEDVTGIRIRYLALAAGTIAVGLFVNRRGDALAPVVRDVLGDALWAMMVVWWLAAIGPAMRLPWRGAVALAICLVVIWWIFKTGYRLKT